MKFLLTFLLALFCLPVLAQTVGESSSNLGTFFDLLGPIIGPYAASNPWVAKILSYMVMARVFVKPLMSMIVQVEGNMPGEWGAKKFLQSMAGHWAYKAVAYLLDWAFSIKLPKEPSA